MTDAVAWKPIITCNASSPENQTQEYKLTMFHVVRHAVQLIWKQYIPIKFVLTSVCLTFTSHKIQRHSSADAPKFDNFTPLSSSKDILGLAKRSQMKTCSGLQITLKKKSELIIQLKMLKNYIYCAKIAVFYSYSLLLSTGAFAMFSCPIRKHELIELFKSLVKILI